MNSAGALPISSRYEKKKYRENLNSFSKFYVIITSGLFYLVLPLKMLFNPQLGLVYCCQG